MCQTFQKSQRRFMTSEPDKPKLQCCSSKFMSLYTSFFLYNVIKHLVMYPVLLCNVVIKHLAMYAINLPYTCNDT